MPSEIDFPRLSSAELVSSFGGDQAALRRYRMLAALLREGLAMMTGLFWDMGEAPPTL